MDTSEANVTASTGEPVTAGEQAETSTDFFVRIDQMLRKKGEFTHIMAFDRVACCQMVNKDDLTNPASYINQSLRLIQQFNHLLTDEDKLKLTSYLKDHIKNSALDFKNRQTA